MPIKPTWRANTFLNVSVNFLLMNDVSIVFLDLDNTMLTVNSKLMDEAASDWILSLIENGIRVRLLSNNLNSRVMRIAAQLGDIDAHSLSMKPFAGHIVKEVLSTESVDIENAMIIGDGIITDILAANLLGARSVLINPIEDRFVIGWYNSYRRWFIRTIYKDIKIILG
ncbi:MAG: HAD family hydrolase [Candidatus Sacchiramonaceae bacterium]|nr:HAD family hydrolase [Candidatus Saccharimonadaceae bacterium]